MGEIKSMVHLSIDNFLHDAYQRHNRRRQEHLATLSLPLNGRSVLEIGADIGDHTSFFIDRGCRVTVTDARAENLVHVRARFAGVQTQMVDIDCPLTGGIEPHQVVYAYGVLYHLSDPAGALSRMASLATEMLLVETCVSFGAGSAINTVQEDPSDPTQAISGTGCRPTRAWVFDNLKSHFDYVYLTRTQPWHEEFPVDWQNEIEENGNGLFRSVFVASRSPLSDRYLSPHLLDLQCRELGFGGYT